MTSYLRHKDNIQDVTIFICS